LTNEKGKLSTMNNFVCGLLAGFAEAIIAVTPMEVINIKLKLDNKNNVDS
jgi:hypothetical protein